MKNAFSIGKKNNSTYSDLKIKAMESHSMAWGNVTDIWYAKKEKAKMSDNRSYLKYSVTECMRLFKEDCQGMPKKILLKAGDQFKVPKNREVCVEYGKDGMGELAMNRFSHDIVE